MLSFRRFRKPAWRGIALGLVCAIVAWCVSHYALEGLDDWMLDGFFQWRGKRATRANIILIGLDGPSLDALGKPAAYLSPELAQVVQHVHSQGAAAIGIDLIIPRSMGHLPDISGEEAGRTERKNPIGDARKMQSVLENLRNYVLAWRVIEGGEPLRPLPQWLVNAQADNFGFTDLSEERDQFVRRQSLFIKDETNTYHQFALALLAHADRRSILQHETHGVLTIGDRGIPLEQDDSGNRTLLRINFVGPPTSFEQIPFSGVLAAARLGSPLPQMRDAIVIVGVTAMDQQDYHATPYANFYTRWLATGNFQGLMSGAEIHANILATLIDEAYIRTPWFLHPFPLLLVFGVGLGVAFARVGLLPGALMAMVHHFSWKGFALAAFVLMNWRVNVIAMLLLGLLVYSATFVLRWRVLRTMFGRVKSEAIARALEADPHRLDPGGEERTITVLFADIREFTRFSEAHRPHEVVQLLNEYFKRIVPPIERHCGVIDKYMGDGIMVLFGAPASCPNHAALAVRAAIEMIRQVRAAHDLWTSMDRLNVWKEKGGLRIGIGINTGSVVVGAIGSPGRLDYTAIGDTINVASRVEGQTKVLGSEILIHDTTRESLTESERAELGCVSESIEVTVHNRSEKLWVYAVNVV